MMPPVRTELREVNQQGDQKGAKASPMPAREGSNSCFWVLAGSCGFFCQRKVTMKGRNPPQIGDRRQYLPGSGREGGLELGKEGLVPPIPKRKPDEGIDPHKGDVNLGR